MTDVTVAFLGWNSVTQGWGEAGWGQDITLPTATGAVGSTSITANANVSVTGVGATGRVG